MRVWGARFSDLDLFRFRCMDTPVDCDGCPFTYDCADTVGDIDQSVIDILAYHNLTPEQFNDLDLISYKQTHPELFI